MMDDFLNIAIWVLMAFLMINASLMWFQSSDTFTDNPSLGGTGVQAQNIVDIDDFKDSQTLSACATVSSNLFALPPCILEQMFNVIKLGTGVLGWLWGLLTAWITVLNLSLNGLGTIGDLMKVILIPFFALVEVFAIVVITMKVAGIVRGGS
jgi:hypothetical protein